MNYLANISSFIDYIEKKLFQNNVLSSALAAIPMSRYHFQRIFLSYALVSPMDYIRKRRFTIIAQELFNSNKRITDIAFDCCYESVESFTRAFTLHFNVSPSSYRKMKSNNPLLLYPAINTDFLIDLKPNISVEPVFEHIESLSISGIKSRTNFMDGSLEAAWKDFFP